MSGDNGDSILQPTAEELKKKAFESNPDNFVCVDDLIIAVQRTDHGVETLVAPTSREELEIALSRITHQCYGIFNAMSHAAQKASKSRIIKPGRI